MNISVTFYIHVKTWQTQRVYKMLVEHYYSSEQVERFRIKGKQREILLEKRLTVHKQPWKVAGDVDTTNIEQAAMAIRDTQDAIDQYLLYRKDFPIQEGLVTLDELRKAFNNKHIKDWSHKN